MAHRKPSRSATFCWTPIREPTDEDLASKARIRLPIATGATVSAVSMLSFSELIVFKVRVSFSTSVTSALRLSRTNASTTPTASATEATAAVSSWRSSASAAATSARSFMNARTTASFAASTWVNLASELTVSNRSPLPCAERLRRLGEVADHLVAQRAVALEGVAGRGQRVVQGAVLVDAVGAERDAEVLEAGVDAVELDRDPGVRQAMSAPLAMTSSPFSKAGVSWTKRSATRVGVTTPPGRRPARRRSRRTPSRPGPSCPRG